MKQPFLSIISKILVSLFIGVLAYCFFLGLTTVPVEGDSIAYHIPIAKSVLSGAVFHPTFYLGFYPSNAEVLLSFLLLLHIPLNIFNVLAIVVLFFVCFFLGKTFKLSSDFSIIFAISVCMLNTMLRWAFAQVIDIWLLNFFLTTITLLERPKEKSWYFLLLGSLLGLLIGAKYSALLFAGVLLIFYYKKLLKVLSIKNFLLFLLPVLIFGFSWFSRNYFVVGNPIYPQGSFLFPNAPEFWHIFSIHVWEAIVHKPIFFFNALVDEFMLWPIIFVVLFLIFLKKRFFSEDKMLRNVFLIGLGCFFMFLFLPTSYEYNIIVSSFRYSYPAFILFFLCGFLVAQKMKLEVLFSLFTGASLLVVLIPPYHPKILFVVLPVILIFYKTFLFIESKRILD